MLDVECMPRELLKILTRIYQKRQSVIIIKGIPQSGKTSFALLLMQCLKQLGLIEEFATNAPVLTDRCPWIKKIEALNLLQTWGYSSKRKKLFVYDELIESATNRRAMNELNVAWVRNLGQISHQSMHILALVQQEEGGKQFYESAFVDPAHLRGVWVKETRTTAVFKSRFYEEWKDGFRLMDIPRTDVPFDKNVHAFFQLNAATTMDQLKTLPLTLQVALLYSKPDIGYLEVQQRTGLPHKKQVQREIKKALRLLLQTDGARDVLSKVEPAEIEGVKTNGLQS